MTAAETLAELVSIDSVSSHSNAEIISYLAARCEAAGFSITRFPHTDENGVEKINLVAMGPAKASTTVRLVLVGHTDTVPYDPTWTEALRLTEKDGKLFGRGACDTKEPQRHRGIRRSHREWLVLPGQLRTNRRH